MKPKIKIWTLNHAASIISGKEKEIIEIFSGNGRNSARIDCSFGNRRKYNRTRKVKKGFVAHNLMCEMDTQYDEYFVPIPVKCIGKLFNQNNQKIEEIKNYYRTKGQQHYSYFWKFGYRDDKYPSNRRARMCTTNQMGYYEILAKERERGYRNILIGYSQGGLVARYLAWLDEYVFLKDAIAGIITISSPNFGSPLANPDNAENILGGIIECVMAFFSFYNDYYGDLLNILKEVYDPESLVRIIDALMAGIQREKKKTHLEGFVVTMRKWLGGLYSIPNNSLYDLNNNLMDDKHSVLAIVNRYPPRRILYGSIVSMQNSVHDLISHSIPWIKLISFFKRNIFNRRIEENYKRVAKIYRDRIMLEMSKSSDPLFRRRIRYYTRGIPELRNSIKAHDFIIPSAYQMLEKSGNSFLGNVYNRKADHNSGKSRRYPGGRENLKYIKHMLIRMNTVLSENNKQEMH